MYNIDYLEQPQQKILVVGDIMLDKYWYGNATRISPEAPVPVVNFIDHEDRIGGAGNVALNIKALSQSVIFLGIVGQDANGKIVQNLLNKHDIETHLIETVNQPTITKLRVLSHNQQLLRLDTEDKFGLNAAEQTQFAQKFKQLLTTVKLVVFSDYNKGTLSNIQDLINIAKQHNVTVIVDPKLKDFAFYKHADVITPNFSEFVGAVNVGLAAKLQQQTLQQSAPQASKQSSQQAELLATFSDTDLIKLFNQDENALQNFGWQLLDQYNIGSMVLTRGAKGLSTFVNNNALVAQNILAPLNPLKNNHAKPDVIHIPVTSSAVFDVTGAGDTVVATIAAGLNSGIDLVNSTQLASYAAGIVVAKVGTAVATLAELKAKILQHAFALSAQKNNQHEATNNNVIACKTGVVSIAELKELIKTCKQHGEKIVFVNGCYDVIHYGHIRYFAKAKTYGQRLIVGINSDNSIRALKGPTRPINNLAARMEVVAGLKPVDWVVGFEEQTPGKLVEALQPDVLIKTSDSFQTVADVPATEGAHFVLANGGEVVLVDRTDGCSSTAIIEAANLA